MFKEIDYYQIKVGDIFPVFINETKEIYNMHCTNIEKNCDSPHMSSNVNVKLTLENIKTNSKYSFDNKRIINLIKILDTEKLRKTHSVVDNQWLPKITKETSQQTLEFEIDKIYTARVKKHCSSLGINNINEYREKTYQFECTALPQQLGDTTSFSMVGDNFWNWNSSQLENIQEATKETMPNQSNNSITPDIPEGNFVIYNIETKEQREKLKQVFLRNVDVFKDVNVYSNCNYLRFENNEYVGFAENISTLKDCGNYFGFEKGYSHPLYFGLKIDCDIFIEKYSDSTPKEFLGRESKLSVSNRKNKSYKTELPTKEVQTMFEYKEPLKTVDDTIYHISWDTTTELPKQSEFQPVNVKRKKRKINIPQI